MKNGNLSATGTEFIIANDVELFVRLHNMELEFIQIKDRLASVFNNPERIAVELFSSPEDDGDGDQRIVFTVKSDFDRQAFKRAIEDFFSPLRVSNSRLYPLMGVLREL